MPPPHRPATWPLALVALLLLAPASLAHVQHERPRVQETQELRDLRVGVEPPTARFELLHRADPLVEYVRHTVDARRGTVTSEYRPHASDGERASGATFVLTRIIEYRDQNRDGTFVPGVDPLARTWTPTGYQWNVSQPTAARVADVRGQIVRFQGNASGSPSIRLEAFAAGTAFVDEGANVRQQDLALYLNISGFPPRGTGNLHTIEGEVRPIGGGDVRLIEGPNFTAGVAVESPRRLALLDWGAEGEVDGRETRLVTTLEPPDAEGRSLFRIHLPLLDRSVDLLLVAGVEYVKEDKRAPGATVGAVLSVLALAAMGRGRRVR